MSAGTLADRVRASRSHKIRAGTAHRFIVTSFVAVGERVFCRRYSFGEPSWHSAFLADPVGQISLDGDLVDVLGGTPDDLESINPAVNDAYIAKLTAQGAQSWISWVREPRVMASTLELMAD
jgi:hypothetical protein